MGKGKRRARVEEEEEEDDEGTLGIGDLWEADVPPTWSQEQHTNPRQSKRNGHDEWGGQQTGAYPMVQTSNHHADGMWGINTGGKGTENPYPTTGWGPTGPQKPASTNEWAWSATQSGKPLAADTYPGIGWGASGGKGPVDTSTYGWGPQGGSTKTPVDAYPGWPADGGNKATEDSWPGGFVAQGGQQHQPKPDRRQGRAESDWAGGGNQFDDLWDGPGPGRGRTPHKNNQGNVYEPPRSNAGDPWDPAPQTNPNPVGDWSAPYQGDYNGNPQTGTAHTLLNALRAMPGPGGTLPHGRPMQDQERAKPTGKKNRKNKKQQHDQSLWTMEEEPLDSYDNPVQNSEQAPWSTTIGTSWGEDSYSLPSKAFALASDGRQAVSSLGPKGTSQLHTYFVDSRGEALLDAEKALFSSARLARDRIHWTFSPTKDERVSSLLEWIELMKHGLATFGLNQFLQSRERGALVSNADYRPYHSPNEPAFDWISYDDVVRTQDRIFQESLAYYDPTTQILVFVFLLSKTGNSMAIWRRKLPIPNNLRLSYGRELVQTISGLRKQYPIYLDEDPKKALARSGPITPEVPKKLSKRKWLRWGF